MSARREGKGEEGKREAHFGETSSQVGSDEELDSFYFCLDQHELEVFFF